MSSPISSITDARLPGLQSTSSTSGSVGRRLSSQLAGVEIGQSDINEMQTGQMQLAMVRAAVLTINVNQFEAAFEQVMKTATTVDPATGHREMTATADSKLSDALQNLLLASGFTEQQAQAASASFAEQLAKGGSISLSASFAATSTNTVTVSGFSKAIIGNVVLSAGNGTTMSASVTSVVTRAGSVSITFDPDSGALSVSLESHTVSAGSSIFAAATLDTRATSLPPGNTTTVGQHPNSDGTNDDKDSHLRGLIAGLANPALHDASTALDLLRIAASAAQTKNAAKDAGTEPGDRVRNHAKPVTVTVGFTQPLSIASHGENGNRAALFKRPDGSTGVVSFSPVNVEA